MAFCAQIVLKLDDNPTHPPMTQVYVGQQIFCPKSTRSLRINLVTISRDNRTYHFLFGALFIHYYNKTIFRSSVGGSCDSKLHGSIFRGMFIALYDKRRM